MRPGVAAGVDQLGGVLLHVHPVDAAAELLVADPVLEPPVGGERLVVLADLVRLGQVGIEVVLAVEDVARLHGAVERQRDARGVLDGALVDHGQRAGVREAHRAGVRLGSSPLVTAQPQNILVCVSSSTCISRPITGSQAAHDCAPLSDVPDVAVGSGPRVARRWAPSRSRWRPRARARPGGCGSR